MSFKEVFHADQSFWWVSLILPASLAVLSPFALALEDQRADPVVVTATRTAQTANESISTVRVLTREEILQRQAKSVPDLLKGEAGIHFTNNGGRGKNSSLFMRGTNSDHVLVLVDGIKVGSATTGSVAFQDLPVEQIERIEIVRGPRSSLYGSEAIGGVIQIFTRKGGGDIRPSFSVTAGTDDTYEATAGLSGGGDNLFYNFSISGIDTQGFDSCQAEAGTVFRGCFIDEPDRDGYENLAGSLRLGYQFENGAEVSLSALRSDSESEFDGSSQNNNESVQKAVSVNASLPMVDIWWIKLIVGRSQDKSDNFHDADFASSIDTTRDTISLQNDFTLFDRDILTIGGDYQRDEVDTYGDQNFDFVIDDADQFAETTRENLAGFVQYQLALDQQSVELSLRHDDDEQFGSQVTGGVGYGVAMGKGLHFVTSYGTAYKAPSFNELYYPGFGNPDLHPEESETVELGLRGSYAVTRWSLVYFNTEVDELINYDASFTPANIDEARITGVEFELDQQLAEDWQIGLALTVQKPRNESDDANNGNLLARRPERSGRVDVDYQQPRWSAGATIFMAGRSFDDAANTRKLNSYNTFDLRAQVELIQSWLLQGRIENLFDTEYETAEFYNQPGFGLYITLRYAPK